MSTFIDWEAAYVSGETHWDQGQASPPLMAEAQLRPIQGPALVIGCGPGHDLAALADLGVDAFGLDISPTAIAKAQRNYPEHQDRFLVGDLFDLPQHLRGRFNTVVEHTCLSGMPPDIRPLYAQGVRSALAAGGKIVGVWYINPNLDPGEEGPPFPLPVADLDQLFAADFDILADYIPENSFPQRAHRERVRVLQLKN